MNTHLFLDAIKLLAYLLLAGLAGLHREWPKAAAYLLIVLAVAGGMALAFVHRANPPKYPLP